MSQKTVLITGTSSGVGLETALLFAENDYQVYASMRNLAKKDKLLEAADSRNVTLKIIEMDVSQVDSIQQAVKLVLEEQGQIDILVNNAGAGFAKTTENATDEEIRWVIETNLLSVIRCTKAVLPAMRARNSGHVINISSVGGLVGQPFNELYCAAKFGVEGFTESMATYITPYFNIYFSAIEPGGILTAFGKSATDKTMGTDGLPNDAYMPIIQKYIGGMQKRAESGDAQSYQKPEDVAQVILEVAQSEHPPLRKRTSGWAEDLCNFKTEKDPDGMLQTADVSKRYLG